MAKRGTVDWLAARTYWLAGYPEITFRDVGRRFQVSSEAVGQHARAEGWKADALKLAARENRRALGIVARTRDERNAELRLLVDQAMDSLAGRPGEAKWSDLASLLKHLELVDGEPTERVSFDELQAALRILMGLAIATAERVAAAHLNGDAVVFVAEFRAVFTAEAEKALGQ